MRRAAARPGRPRSCRRGSLTWCSPLSEGDDRQLEHVGAARPDARQQLRRRLLVNVDPGDRRLGALEDDVLRLVRVDARPGQLREHGRERARLALVPHDQRVGGRRLLRQVDHVGHPPGLLEDPHDAHRLGGDRLLGLVGRGADVMRPVHPGQAKDGVRELGRRAGRLAGVHVDADPDALLLHRRGQRAVVHDVRPRGVDDVRAGLQPADHIRVDDVLRQRARRQVDAQHVALLGDLGRGLRHADPLRDQRARARTELQQQREVDRDGVVVHRHTHLAPDHQVHAEGHRPLRHLLADLPEAEEPERHPVQALRLRVLLLVPLAAQEIGHVVGDPPVEGDQQPEGQFRHSDRVLAGAVRDVDAPLARGLHVDGVVAGTRPHDEREAAGVQHRLGDHGGPHHQHVRSRRGERVLQRVVLQVRLMDDLATEGLEPLDTALLELVGNENLHSCPSLDRTHPARFA